MRLWWQRVAWLLSVMNICSPIRKHYAPFSDTGRVHNMFTIDCNKSLVNFTGSNVFHLQKPNHASHLIVGAFIVTTRYTHNVKTFAAPTAPGNYLHCTEQPTWLIWYNETTVRVVCTNVLYFPNIPCIYTLDMCWELYNKKHHIAQNVHQHISFKWALFSVPRNSFANLLHSLFTLALAVSYVFWTNYCCKYSILQIFCVPYTSPKISTNAEGCENYFYITTKNDAVWNHPIRSQ